MCKGKVYLQREDCCYIAGFGIVDHNITKKNDDLIFLHEEEKKHYKSLKYDHQKLNYLLGRRAAKMALGELLTGVNAEDVFIDRGVFGFPLVTVQNIQVSISHCDNRAIALAFSEGHPLGIDLEKVDDGKMEAMKLAMTAPELKRVNDFPFAQYCTMVWTIKEGLSKVLKTGLTLNFALIELEVFEKKGRFYVSTFKHFGQYKAVSYCFGEYVCSVVLPKKTEADVNDFFNALEDCEN